MSTIAIRPQRQAYESLLDHQPDISLAEITSDISSERLEEAAWTLNPDVMFLGVKTLKVTTVQTLELIREACPDMGLVLVFAFFDGQSIEALKKFSRNSSVGCAYLLKHTIDKGEQLTQVIRAVAEGRVVIDRIVMEQLISSGDSSIGPLRDLSPKALEILSLLAKGYRNDTIAEMLSRDVKTVERHINNIYSSLEDAADSMHPRVQAVLMDLKTKGLLSTEQLIEGLATP